MGSGKIYLKARKGVKAAEAVEALNEVLMTWEECIYTLIDKMIERVVHYRAPVRARCGHSPARVRFSVSATGL